MRAVFGPFCFDLDTLELTKYGVRLGLEEKPARALTRLIERRGTLVSREELRNSLWDQSVNVDFNHGLNKALNKLRTVLGDDANQPKYLETLSRRGYRFIAEIELIESGQTDTGNSAFSSVLVSNGNGRVTGEHAPAVATDDIPVLTRPHEIDAQRRNSLLLLAGAALLITVVALVIGFPRTKRSHEPPAIRALIKLPPDLQLMTASENLGLAISPDGTQIVFSAEGSDGVPRLWLRSLDALTPQPIAGTERGSFPFWSPDGKKLGFFTESQLKRVNLADHSVITLCPVESPRGGTWSRFDVILLASDTRGPIYKISADGGTPVPATKLNESRYTTHRWPAFLADGTHFVFLAANHGTSWAPGSIYLASIKGGEPKPLGEADSNVVTAGNSLLFLSHGKLMSQLLSLEGGRLESHATIVAEGVQFDPGLWYGPFAASGSTVLYRQRPEKPERETISWFDRKGNKLGDVGPSGVYRGVSLSPDGKTIAVLCGDPEMNVCLIHGDRSITQITEQGIHGVLAWLNDSSAISYYTHQSQSDSWISLKPLDGVGQERVITSAEEDEVITSWHPDGRHALVMKGVATDTFECLVLDRATGKLTRYLSAETGSVEYPRFSPDGHWVAYERKNGDMVQIRIASYPVASVEYSLPVAPAMGPKWRGDGRELYFLGQGEKLFAAAVSPVNNGLRVGKPRPLFHPPIFPFPWNRSSFDVARDGSKFLVNRVEAEDASELVLATNWLRE